MTVLIDIRGFLKTIDSKIPTIQELDARYAKSTGEIIIAPAIVFEGEVSGPYMVLDK